MVISDQRGFSLADLFVCLTLFGLLTGYAIPSFSRLLHGVKLGTEANRFLTHYQLARSSAVLTGNVIHLCVRKKLECDNHNDWSNGCIIYQDKNDNQQIDDEEILRIGAKLPDHFSLQPNVNTSQIVFFPNGNVRKLNGTLPLMTFNLCSLKANDTNQHIYARELVINGSGRVRLQHGREGITPCAKN